MNLKHRQFDAASHSTDVPAASATSARQPQSYATETQSPGDSLLQIGRLIRFLVRHGADPADAADGLGVDLELSSIAFAFAEAPDLLKLRALFEDWSLDEIASQLK